MEFKRRESKAQKPKKNFPKTYALGVVFHAEGHLKQKISHDFLKINIFGGPAQKNRQKNQNKIGPLRKHNFRTSELQNFRTSELPQLTYKQGFVFFPGPPKPTGKKNLTSRKKNVI